MSVVSNMKALKIDTEIHEVLVMYKSIKSSGIWRGKIKTTSSHGLRHIIF